MLLIALALFLYFVLSVVTSNLPVIFNFCSTCGRSPGYGVSLVAETTTGCLLSVDATVSYPSVDEINEESEKPELMSPEDLGVQAASVLLEEVAQGGVVDSTHQVFTQAVSSLQHLIRLSLSDNLHLIMHTILLCLMIAQYFFMWSMKLRQGYAAFICCCGLFMSSKADHLLKFYMACR